MNHFLCHNKATKLIVQTDRVIEGNINNKYFCNQRSYIRLMCDAFHPLSEIIFKLLPYDIR